MKAFKTDAAAERALRAAVRAGRCSSAVVVKTFGFGPEFGQDVKVVVKIGYYTSECVGHGATVRTAARAALNSAGLR